MPSTNGASSSAAVVFFFFVFFLACTALALLNVYPGDVHQNTSEIYMWSTLGFELIYSRPVSYTHLTLPTKRIV